MRHAISTSRSGGGDGDGGDTPARGLAAVGGDGGGGGVAAVARCGRIRHDDDDAPCEPLLRGGARLLRSDRYTLVVKAPYPHLCVPRHLYLELLRSDRSLRCDPAVGVVVGGGGGSPSSSSSSRTAPRRCWRARR